jgi:hypothetical protein
MCHKLGHIDLWDTTFAFAIRHDIPCVLIPARTKYELKKRGLSDRAAGRRDSQNAPLHETDVARRPEDRHFSYTRECKLRLLILRLKTKD